MPNAYYLSANQTFLPFNVFRSNELQQMIIESNPAKARTNNSADLNYKNPQEKPGLFDNIRGVRITLILILQSVTSLALIACLLLGLRWNFRKA